MPRNGSGTMSIPTTFVANTPALAADVNTNFTDVATALTGSLALDGQSAMTGQLKAADGNAAAPGVTFGADLDTGFYRIGSNSFGAAVNGALIATFNTSGITLASGKTVSFPATGPGLIPTGAIHEWGGTIASIPTGFLFCDGAAVSRTTYAALFAVIGTLHGAGDGSTTFNLPDKRDVFNIGARQDDSGVPKTNVTGSLAASGGTKDAINVSHTHTATVTDPGHVHDIEVDYSSVGSGGGSRQYWSNFTVDSITQATKTNKALSKVTGVTVANSTEGSSGTNANLPPYKAAVYMIKT
jgi:microcystin-dependent protein